MRLHSSVSLPLVAERTTGYVGADIKGLCVEAGLICIRTSVERARRRTARAQWRAERSALQRKAAQRMSDEADNKEEMAEEEEGESGSDVEHPAYASHGNTELVIDDKLLSAMEITARHFEAALSSYTSNALRAAGALAVHTGAAGTGLAAASASASGGSSGAAPAHNVMKKIDEIGGNEATKQQLMETLAFPLMYPQLFAKYGLSASSGLLLYGV
jgi:SpoVK/Ycf46/Vps4 family AAA+-type ATPase